MLVEADDCTEREYVVKGKCNKLLFTYRAVQARTLRRTSMSSTSNSFASSRRTSKGTLTRENFVDAFDVSDDEATAVETVEFEAETRELLRRVADCRNVAWRQSEQYPCVSCRPSRRTFACGSPWASNRFLAISFSGLSIITFNHDIQPRNRELRRDVVKAGYCVAASRVPPSPSRQLGPNLRFSRSHTLGR